MKSTALVTLICLSIATGALAQPSPTAASLKDSVALMYQQYLDLAKRNASLADSLNRVNQSLTQINTTWGKVDERLSRITEDLSTSLTQVNRLTKDDFLTKEARLNTKRDKILATATFVRSANNSFDAIDAALAQSDYLSDVGSLSSPTNTDLGFSLADEIETILNEKIVKNKSKIGGNNTDKVLGFIKEVVQNPIVTGFTSSVPALGSINAVVNMVSNLAVNDKKVSVDEYLEFNRELKKYIVHYEALGEANGNFSSKINKLRTQSEALRVIMRNFTTERVLTTVPDAAINSDMPNHRIISQYYDRVDLTKRLDEILASYERDGQLDLQRALDDTRLDLPFYAVNQAQFIQQELESITNEYIATYEQYHEDITKVLINSKKFSKDPTKIDIKINDLSNKLERSLDAFKRNVKVTEVSSNLQRIPNL